MTPDIIYGVGIPPDGWLPPDWAERPVAFGRINRNAVSLYHMKGAQKNTDWYGPMLPDVLELHRKIDEAQQKALVSASANQ